MSSEAKLGSLIESTAERDAIHVAIAPVIADEAMLPGEKIGLVAPGSDHVVLNPFGQGIVDPFLTRRVQPGERFFMALLPGTVTGMRHHWAHPAFEPPQPNDKEKSVAWLKDAARTLGVDYEDLICEGGSLETGDYINNGEHIRDEWCEIADEFWKHHKIVTGRDVPEGNRGGFTCSC